ncbi:MAG TPA: HAMP domain-containing sensor histidine kinase [Actinomycetes bacterium]|nr:HAMP domain-containing sensor histidine kinase [Actinomycetes bacterium]
MSASPPPWSSHRLPEWMRSIRFRYTLLYSAVLFGLAVLVVGAIYLILWFSLRDPTTPIINSRVFNDYTGRSFSIDIVTARAFERLVHQQTLEKLRTFSFDAIIVLFFASLVVGWVIAGRVLAPIGRITGVAREIQATDLSRRIRLQGPDDELKQLADTFDAMLARLDAAFAAQQQFLADASHELRNPLAIIRTNADIALSDPNPHTEDMRQAVVVVKRASDRMARLVDDLLALARREAPTLANEPVDLGRAVTEASEEFFTPAEARGVELDRAIAPGVVVMGDQDALKRAVANLLENAVRLAPSGSRIRLALGSERGMAWIAVSDEGPGIATEDQPRVFDRFWRADKARSRADGGTGLGLSIVRQIAQTHGGHVQLQSKLGVGSTFTIWLPVVSATADPAPRLTSSAPR